MKTALDHYGLVPEHIRQPMVEMFDWLQTLPDPPEDIIPDGLWSCHMIARAALMNWKLAAFGWEVRDGYFCGNYQHSWLVKDQANRLILDVYPVGSFGGPLLVDASISAPWHRLYVVSQTAYTSRQYEFNQGANLLLGIRVAA